MGDENKLRQYLTQECCTQAIVHMGMDALGVKDDVLLQGLSGLCGGMHAGYNCGALAGAAILLAMFDKKNAAAYMIPALCEWFEETYGEPYGGINCRDITQNDPLIKAQRCRNLIVDTYLKAKELLEEFGYQVEETE